MNYRRGLQRAYMVLTVAWIAGVMSTVLTGHWEPWHRFEQQNGWSVVSETPIVSPEQFFGKARLSDIDEAETQRMMLHQRIGWAFGVSVIPTLAVYLTLFLVAPWVYRGFRPSS